ncbi:MAG TPA: ABC transporter substrate-binding protein [Candidatus Avacidaminococcus intestinavium]|uniref:ABC transporter substrate-binding protein n=1 Tax=Candidatus Avacidaminococcus intestinavium TaxID=2840684 RepID=A0A9D1MNT9_9FIRM|nr:ABC transporter substrate-binding protein [Candidatus Avacidaminococcus intestinavium]
MKKMHKALTVAAVSMLMLTVLTGCGSAKKGSEDTIKIGANLEMTGSSASYGKSAQNGIRLAIEDANAKGGVLGKKLEVVIADNKSEAAEAANAMQKLVAQDKVVAVIGPNLSSLSIATTSITTGSKVMAISPMGTNPSITVDKDGKTKDFMFRACFIDPFQGTVMATFAKDELQVKNVALLIDNSSDYAKGLAQFFKEAFIKTGGTIVAEESYLQKDTDFKATLTKIKAQNPDMIYIPGYYQEVGMIIKQAREMGINVPMTGGDTWDSAKLPEIAGKAALDNSYFSSLYSPDDDSQVNKDFVTAYQKAYGEKPDVFAALNYDATLLVINAIKTAEGTDTVKIKDAMASTKDFNGVSGNVTFNEQHNPVKSAVIIEYKDGVQVFKTKINP